MIEVNVRATLTELPKPFPRVMVAERTVYLPALPRPGDTLRFLVREPDEEGPDEWSGTVEAVLFMVDDKEVEVSLGTYQYGAANAPDWPRFDFSLWEATLPEDEEVN